MRHLMIGLFLNKQKMAEISTLLGDPHIVRTYPADYAQSETEQEGEAQFEGAVDAENENEEQNSISTRLEQNQEYMDQFTDPPPGKTSSWELERQAWLVLDTGIELSRMRFSLLL